MKLQNLIVIFIVITLPVILILSLYISTGLKTISYQSIYDTGLLTATHDAIEAFEINTANDTYSDNPETKRDILKASVKMFEKSLANTCGISSYNVNEIEEYIPAIVFGMYDGFYMYAPSKLYDTVTKESEYKHNLKNYVYYSEELDDGTVIRYTLDNYVSVSGEFGNGYETKEGYLSLNIEKSGTDYKYYGCTITDDNAKKYCEEALTFTNWFKDKFKSIDYLDLRGSDPEDESSKFVYHKRQIIKNKIENVLNSSITAYSERKKGEYKMPSFSEEEWQRIYSNISMITFFQGKSIGLTKYNGYCVLNSTNNNEYVNPNLIYFIDKNKNNYHDIRCNQINSSSSLVGYRIGRFEKIREEREDNGTYKYKYNNFSDNERDPVPLACYYCVNGNGGIDLSKSVYEYVKTLSRYNSRKVAYFNALARERYLTIKL